MKKTIILVYSFIILSISACTWLYKAPKLRDFKYYDPNFSKIEKKPVRTDGFYWFRVLDKQKKGFPEGIGYYRFTNNGKFYILNLIDLDDPKKVHDVVKKHNLKEQYQGYYRFSNNKLFLNYYFPEYQNLKNYWFDSEAIVKGDSLMVEEEISVNRRKNFIRKLNRKCVFLKFQ